MTLSATPPCIPSCRYSYTTLKSRPPYASCADSLLYSVDVSEPTGSGTPESFDAASAKFKSIQVVKDSLVRIIFVSLAHERVHYLWPSAWTGI